MPRTKYLLINSKRPEPEKIKAVARVLKKGGIAAFPTETVYGLAVLAGSGQAVKKIYRLKKRPLAKELTIQVAEVKKLSKLIPEIPARAKQLLKRFSPGPLTLILKKKRGSIGIRIPKHKISQAILKEIDEPLVVTSANFSGTKDAKTAQEVKRFFAGKIDLIVKGGKTSKGKASTVVDLTRARWRILRPGKIKAKEIKKTIEKAG